MIKSNCASVACGGCLSGRATHVEDEPAAIEILAAGRSFHGLVPASIRCCYFTLLISGPCAIGGQYLFRNWMQHSQLNLPILTFPY